MKNIRLSNNNRSSSKRLKAFWLASGAFLALFVATALFIVNVERTSAVSWTPQQIAVLSSLRLPKEGINFSDSSNKWLKDPQAIELGRRIFFDQRFSRNQKVACSTCHQPDRFFSDGRQFSRGVDGLTKLHTPSLIGVAMFRWQFWDGRADSLWAQALEPLEQSNEHGLDRMTIIRRFIGQYGVEYEGIFGEKVLIQDFAHLPAQASPKSSNPAIVQAWDSLSSAEKAKVNRIFANVGKSLAAFQATLMPEGSRFDHFVQQLEAKQRELERVASDTADHQRSSIHLSGNEGAWLTDSEQAGLKIFIDDSKGRCTRCHNGPMLSNGSFQATSVPPVEKGGHLAATPALQLTPVLNEPKVGRAKGINEAWSNEFNCLSTYSDASPDDCGELQFAKRTGIELQRAFKVPTLRNIEFTAPYMHQGQFENLLDLLKYYNDAPLNGFSHTELEPLGLLPHELRQLKAFLLSLSDINNRQYAGKLTRASG